MAADSQNDGVACEEGDDSAAYAAWALSAELEGQVRRIVENVDLVRGLKEANEVIDGFLWLGSRSDAAHAFWLEAMGITHVLNVAGASARGHVEGVTYLELDGEDDEDYELLRELWPRCKAFLDGARSSAGARVLVHCSAGINRSACIAVLTNDGFIRELAKLELGLISFDDEGDEETDAAPRAAGGAGAAAAEAPAAAATGTGAVSVRVASLNVSEFKSPTGRPNWQGVKDAIVQAAPDVVCLQAVRHPLPLDPSVRREIWGAGDPRELSDAAAESPEDVAAPPANHMSALAECLNDAMPGSCWQWAVAGNDGLGVAILSRFPISAVRAVPIDVTDDADISHRRVMLLTRVLASVAGEPAAPQPLLVHVVQLSDASEAQRLGELREIAAVLISAVDALPPDTLCDTGVEMCDLGGGAAMGVPQDLGGPHLLVGDFAALHRPDYADKQWEAISRSSADGAPDGRATETLLGNVSEGGYGYVDAATARPAGSALSWTTSSDTRTDYILASTASVGRLAPPSLVRGTFVTSDNGASAHRMVAVSVEVMNKPPPRPPALPVTFRLATPEDAEVATLVVNRAFAAENFLVLPGLERTNVDEMAGFIADPATEIWLIEAAAPVEEAGASPSLPVGVMMFKAASPYTDAGVARHAYLGMLSVVPAAQGRGVASAALQHALHRGREEGCDALDIKVVRESLVQYYKRHGFREVRREPWPEPSLSKVVRPQWHGKATFTHMCSPIDA